MTPQTKALIVGASGLAVARFYYHKDWKSAAIIGLITTVTYLVVTDLPDTIV